MTLPHFQGPKLDSIIVSGVWWNQKQTTKQHHCISSVNEPEADHWTASLYQQCVWWNQKQTTEQCLNLRLYLPALHYSQQLVLSVDLAHTITIYHHMSGQSDQLVTHLHSWTGGKLSSSHWPITVLDNVSAKGNMASKLSPNLVVTSAHTVSIAWTSRLLASYSFMIIWSMVLLVQILLLHCQYSLQPIYC